MKFSIPMIQYTRPHGHQVEGEIAHDSADLDELVQKILLVGYRFECEVLRTGDFSLTIHDPAKSEDIAIELIFNPKQYQMVERQGVMEDALLKLARQVKV